MFKKTITYTDFNDEEVTEDFYFHLSKTNLIELEAESPGGLAGHMQRIIDTQDARELVVQMKKLIAMTYGVKSEDGKRFEKDPIRLKQFENTPAYDILFTELATDAEKAAEFVNGIVPNELAAQVREATSRTLAEQNMRAEARPQPTTITLDDARAMSNGELEAGLREGRYVLVTQDSSSE